MNALGQERFSWLLFQYVYLLESETGDLELTREIIRTYFPNARIVADRFHVIQHHLLEMFRKIASQIKTTLTSRAISCLNEIAGNPLT